MEFIDKIINAIKEGNVNNSQSYTRKALEYGISIDDILSKCIIFSIEEVGKKFLTNDYFIPDILISARAVNASLKIIKKERGYSEVYQQKPIKIVIGTVRGDIHNIGKSIVKLLIEISGMEIIDLGVDVSPEKFLEAVKKYKPHVLMLSALLTTTMIEMKNTIDLLNENIELRKGLKILVGGSPVTEEYAYEINADYYTANLNDMIEWLKENIYVE